MKKFILSFISPKEMIVHRDMNIFIAILLFFGCLFISIGSSNLMAPRYFKQHYQEILLYQEFKQVDDITPITLPKVKTEVPENGLFKEIVYDAEIDGKTYHYTHTFEDETVLNALIVYDLNFYFEENIKLNFDLEGYYRHIPAENVKDALFIVTKRYLIYVHNHGRFEDGQVYYERATVGKSIYQVNSDGTIKYFLPNDEIEATRLNEFGDIDKTRWTKEVSTTTLKDENGNYYEMISGTKYEAVPHLDWSTKDHLAVQNNLAFDYTSFEGSTFNGYSGPLKDLANSWYDFSIHLHSQALKTANMLNAFLLIILMPLLWIFVTWLMSKRYGELKRFREYYVISAVSFVLPSIVAFVTGFFTPYYLFAKYIMFLQIGFYIFVVFRINASANRYHNETPSLKTKLPNIDVKQIKELSDDLATKPSQIE